MSGNNPLGPRELMARILTVLLVVMWVGILIGDFAAYLTHDETTVSAQAARIVWLAMAAVIIGAWALTKAPQGGGRLASWFAAWRFFVVSVTCLITAVLLFAFDESEATMGVTNANLVTSIVVFVLVVGGPLVVNIVRPLRRHEYRK